MKIRQLKKALGITLAAALLITSVPAGTFAAETNTTEMTTETPPTQTPPTEAPTQTPPTEAPTQTQPTEAPTQTQPTEAPTETKPTEAPTQTQPTEAPTQTPAANPQSTSSSGSLTMQATQQAAQTRDLSGAPKAGKEQVSITWTGETTVVYNNGNEITLPEPSFTTLNDGTKTPKITITAGTEQVDKIVDAGTYILTAVLTAEQADLYEIAGGETQTFNVTQKEVNVTWSASNPTEVTYNGEGQSLALEGADGDKVEVQYVDAQSNPIQGEKPVSVGTYTASVKVKQDYQQNYKVSDTLALDTRTFTIQQLEIKIIIPDQGKNLNAEEPSSLTYSVAAKDGTDLPEKLKESVIAEINTKYPDGILKRVEGETLGEYDISLINNITLINCTITNTDAKGTFKITQEISVEWKNLSPNYNGNAQAPKAYFKDGGSEIECTVTLGVGADQTGQLENGGTAIKAGTYTATASIDSNSYPYYVLSDDTKEFVINKLPITIKIDNKQKVYGADDPAFTYEVVEPAEGFPGNLTSDSIEKELRSDILTRVVDENSENVGEYSITIKSDVDPANYNIVNKDNATGTLTINKLPVTITPAEGQQKVYGADDPAFMYTAKANDGYTTEISNEKIVAELQQEFDQNPENPVSILRRENAEVEDAGEYAYVLNIDPDAPKNYTVTFNGKDDGGNDIKFTINQLKIKIIIKEGQGKRSTEEDPPLTYSVKTVDGSDFPGNLTSDRIVNDINSEYPGGILKREGENVAVKDGYEISLKEGIAPKNYSIQNPDVTGIFMITQTVSVVWKDLALFYNGASQTPKASFMDGENEVACSVVLTGSTETDGTAVNAVNAGIYIATASIAEPDDYPHIELPEETQEFVINKLPVNIIPNSEQKKVYGALDPTFEYTVENTMKNTEGYTVFKSEDDIKKELSDLGSTILRRTGKEDAGEYPYELNIAPEVLDNYTFSYKGTDATGNEIKFTITPLPVTVVPDKNQEKIFGQAEPAYYTYDVIIDDASGTNMKAEDVKKELGNYVLQRTAGEAVGEYAYTLIPKDSELSPNTKYGNFALTVDPNAPKYVIHPVVIESVQAINSRQDSFKVVTNLEGERAANVVTKFKIEAVEFPVSTDGITFSQDMNTYIDHATDGVAFTGTSDTIKIKPATYLKTRKDNGKSLAWNGFLPAGTVVRVSVVDAEGNTVSAESKRVTVTPVSVSIEWSGYETSASTGNYVTAENGSVDSLSLTTDRAGEWAEILYSKNGGGKSSAYYDAMNLTFKPEVNNSGQQHVGQSVTANVVDTLNLKCEEKKLQFYVDDSAFTIPASSIQFENRGDDITIRLPEMGTVNSVTIPGGTVEVSGEMSQEFVLPVSWSGEDLISSGTSISVSYTDQAGHQGTGTAAASRSSVSTPIVFKIRPELNENGYLNGRSSTLIVSGTACSCEPIQVNVAGMTQSAFATQKEVWSDSNGSWEILVDMGSLPENEDFTISAEYVDVNGEGYSVNARFDAFCASASVTSPIYEAMSHISGMVEPGTSVALVVNGDSQDYYEMEVDRFGRFSLDDVPMMFAEEDSFDIYVMDIAGNLSIRHYEIEAPGDPFEVSSSVSPLGKIFYSAEETDSAVYTATPVSAGDFGEKEDKLELPLLMGGSYEVGTLTVEKGENGIRVFSEIQTGDEISSEDYRIENQGLYVYTEAPSISDLSGHTGKEYGYGEEIPMEEGQTVWIAAESDMTILAEFIADLDLYDYERSEEYARYQEQ